MPVVARIEVPPPEPFVEGEGGAEAHGAGYRFIAPRTATEPLVMEAADGSVFLWTPTELCYRDEFGQIDFIAGSAPVQLEVRGREARYRRTFPASDEVHIAQPEGRKYWLILHERPRDPSPYLQGEIWFGVSGIVAGIPLPPGVHKTFNAFAFDFRPPFAADLMDAQTECWYEVVDTENGQMLFIWCRATWLLDPDRVYPVKIDPTIGVDSYTNAGWLAQFNDGTLIFVMGYYGGCWYSFDGGQSWVKGSSIVSQSAFRSMDIDSNDRLWVLHWVPIDSTTGYQVRVYTRNGSSLTTVASGQAKPNQYVLSFVIRGTTGYCIGFNGDFIEGFTLSVSGSNVSASGSYRKDAYYDGDRSASSALSVTRSGSVYAITTLRWGYGSRTKWGPFTSESPQELSQELYSISGINGAEHDWYLHKDTRRLIRGSPRSYVTIPSDVTYIEGAVYVPAEDMIAVVGRTDEGKLCMKGYYPSSGQWSDLMVYNVFPRAGQVYLPKWIRYGSAIPVAFRDANDPHLVLFEALSFNTPPLAPSNLARDPFDAAYPAVFTWQHNDPDSGDGQSAYQLQIRLAASDTNLVDTGEVQSPHSEHLLPRGTLENGRTYQWRVRTADQAGEWSPWSDWAVFQTGPKPVATILYPAAGATVSTSEVTVEWSVPSQSSATVRLYDGTGQTVLQEHEVTTPSARQRTITGLENNQSYQVSVQPVSSIGVVGDEVFSGPFDVAYTSPPKPETTATAQAGFIRVTITNPTPSEGEPEVTHNDIYRREPGGDWVRVATGIEPGSTYDDYAVGSGVVYEYRARAVGANGTYTDSDPVSATVTFDEWRFSPVDGQPEIRFRFDSSVTWRPEEDVQVPRTMSRYQRTYRNPSYPRVATIQARFRDGEDGLTVREQRERLLRYIEQGVVGWLRGPHGDCWRGVLLEPEVLPSTHFARETVTCVFRETREAP